MVLVDGTRTAKRFITVGLCAVCSLSVRFHHWVGPASPIDAVRLLSKSKMSHQWPSERPLHSGQRDTKFAENPAGGIFELPANSLDLNP